jgi:hypothetical protein
MQQALIDFQKSLNRVRNIANDISAKTAAALADPLLRERHETALSAVVVTLSGYFESFLRQTAEEYALPGRWAAAHRNRRKEAFRAPQLDYSRCFGRCSTALFRAVRHEI